MKKVIYLTIVLVLALGGLVAGTPPTSVEAITTVDPDTLVSAVSPVSEVKGGRDVRFNWDLIPGFTQTKFELYTSASDTPIIQTTSDTHYTYTDFPYGYGWWYVSTTIEFNDIPVRAGTSPKHFHHQFPDDWRLVTWGKEKEINYTVEYQADGRIRFFELQSDYKVYLPSYFSFRKPEKLPNCCDNTGTANLYAEWAGTCLEYSDWDFIHLDSFGRLTIKQGYRWDGASYPCKDYKNYCIDDTFNIRSSLVHDALYDLMRMGYLSPDRGGLLSVGYFNKKMADMLLYMIAMEDGQWETGSNKVPDPLKGRGAEEDYFLMRLPVVTFATHDDKRLAQWKYHVSELEATASDGKIELTWKPANASGREPTTHERLYFPEIEYNVLRDGVVIGTVPEGETSYEDYRLNDGATCVYQIRRVTDFWAWLFWHDYSNTCQVRMRYDPCQADSDKDGIGYCDDNCPGFANPGQEDRDDDGIGDACTKDCNGDLGGSAYIDECNVCVGGNTGLEPCVPEPETGSITVVKEINIGAVADGAFCFSSDLLGSFSLPYGGGNYEMVWTDLELGDYTFTESIPPEDWELTHVVCSSDDCTPISDGTIVHLDSGEDIVVIFTNEYDEGETPPVPEMPSILLVSLGLMTLGGFIWIKQRRRLTATV